MNDRARLANTFVVFVGTLLLAGTTAGAAGELVSKGDVCLRAEGLGQLERATLALWIQPHKLPGDFNSILHSDGWERGDWHLIVTSNGELQNSINGNKPRDAKLDTKLRTGKKRWQHLAVVYDAPGKSCVIYLDGKEAERAPYDKAIAVNLDKFCIGAWNGNDRGLPGAYRDIRLYNRALGMDEVKMIHAGEEPSVKPLAWWNSIGKSEKIADASGNGHHAKLLKLQSPTVATAEAGGPVFNQPLDPELNPWQDKGIASKFSFGAYYTRKNVDEKWHQDSRTDEYADVTVRFGEGSDELVFWRGSSYLPYWKTGSAKTTMREIIRRSGDGPEGRPDNVNRYSRVRIIESTPQRAIVHWRYMPNMVEDVGPFNMPDQTRMVDEYFVVYPDRSVVRAVLAGQSRYEDWRKAAPGQVFRYQLTLKGIDTKTVEPRDKDLMMTVMGFASEKSRVVRPSPVVDGGRGLPKPVALFTFDEGKGLKTKEDVSGTMLPIEGHAAHWRGGVSGTALQFDGWTSQVQLQADLSKHVTDSVTLDAWIVIAAYPWNTCPIIQQVDVEGDKETNGFMLAMEANGKPSMWVTVGGKRIELKADALIPRFRWTRLTGVVDGSGDRCTLKLYIDGEMVAQTQGPKGKITLAEDQPVRIAQGVRRMPYLPVGRGQYPSQYSFDGLIDDAGIFGTALTGEQMKKSTAQYAMTDARRTHPDMIRRVLPAGEKSWNDFAARYVHLPFHESWNKMFRVSGHPDIVVSFDKMPCRYVLWHGVGYIPMLVSENGRWYSNEFNENWWKGCCEPMSDKKMVFGRVHVLEQSAARVVLKWRYPLSTVGYEISYENPETGWGNWSTWYLTIYPDGTMVKRMRIYMAKSRGHEWQESMAIMGPEQRPEMVVDTEPALTVATPDGTVREYSWIGQPPKRVDYTDTILHIVNMKAKYDPYSVQQIKGGDIYKARGGTGYSAFPAWNHWPVAQLPSDGRHATFPDRTAHSSLTHIFWDDSVRFGEQGLFQEKLLLEGMSDRPAKELLPMAKSWLQPAAAETGAGVTATYDPAERAYVLTRASGDVKKLAVKLAATKDAPVVNPVFVVPNWGGDKAATIKIDGKKPDAGLDIRQGIVRRANGVNALVVWTEMTTTDKVSFEIAQ